MEEPHEHPQKPASHKTAVLILAALFITIAFYGWRVLGTSRQTLTAVSKPAQIRLTSPRGRASSLRIHVSGWIDGEATLQCPIRESTVIGPGPVEWKAGSDYDKPDCVLEYAPTTATQGQLTVEYRFD